MPDLSLLMGWLREEVEALKPAARNGAGPAPEGESPAAAESEAAVESEPG